MSKLKRYDGTDWQSVNGQIVGDTFPIGGILPYPSSTAPTNWLICDGRAVSRSDYSELFAVIGTTYGSGDGSTTFNLPNLKGRVPVGKDSSQTEFDTIGETGGSKELQEHKHNFIVGNIYYQTGGTNAIVPTNPPGAGSIETSTVGTGNSGNLQPYIVTNYIIKAKQSVGLVGNVIETQSNSHVDTYSCDYVNGIEAEIPVVKTTSSASNVDTYSCNYINSALSNVNVYSTTEVKVGKWINNKDIYRKVLATTTSGTYIEGDKRFTWYPKSSYDANNQIEFITDMRINVVGDRQFFNNSNTEIDLQLYADGQIQLGTISSRTTTSTPVYITIEYTKR